jgi:class 3 adenylate cyclase
MFVTHFHNDGRKHMRNHDVADQGIRFVTHYDLSGDLMDYTIIGMEANLAARLQSIAEPAASKITYIAISGVYSHPYAKRRGIPKTPKLASTWQLKCGSGSPS